MAKKPSVTTITSGYASNTQLNGNFAALRNAFDNTLSLDGSTPNAMLADLDLNNNDLLNVNSIEVVSIRSGGEDIDLSGISTLAPIADEIVTLAQLQDGTVLLYGLSDLHAVKDDIAALGPSAGSIPVVAAIDSEVVTVAGISSDVTTVAANVSGIANFADKYVVSATEPASPTEGMLWYDTSADTMKVYNGTAFVDAGSAVNGTAERTLYTATSGQTVFNATYDVGFVDVYLNGVKLAAGSDFTATNGTSITLATGAALSDVVDIVAYGAFSIANVYTQTQSNTLFLKTASNLSDLANPATALVNLGVNATASELNILDGVTASTAELNYNDITTLGTTQASKVVTADANGDVKFSRAIIETVFAITGTTPALNPNNGTIQTWTLTGASTPTDAFVAGEAMTLMIDDGTAFTITWPSVTWKTNGGVAPILNTTGFTVIVLWKVGTTLYGARVGDA